MLLLIFIIIAVVIFLSRGIIIVRQAEVVIIERFGKYRTSLNSGIHLIIPIIDTIRPIAFGSKSLMRIDLREQVLDFPPQPVITKDNVTMQIDTVIYYQITEPYKAMYEITNIVYAIEKLTITTIRNVIGDLTLDETLVSRAKINSELQVILDDATNKWGVKVNRVELKNINPPAEIQEAMTKQMKAEREKRATILLAEGEKQSKILIAEGERESKIKVAEGEQQAQILVALGQAQAIKSVFQAIHDGKATNDVITLKYLEALEKISNGNGSKIFIPYEATGILSSLGSLKELFKEDGKKE
ncbi:TPA: SPFH/Band 7/PHB domain protein [candidate division WOR-3]|uniref:SPFH/Band 7/PHB domain protein n=1 Tax=candidate division WOR-3 bacterium TaxID=2052148 RepID=A0A348MMQ0_UNCW3|nr:SPFH/Band 7/PHB domain protein [candidate division WOR-3 bacterium]HCP17035.1 SPFH/Band 7/PHB domain protein [candidate division WOR-3 bacterium]